MNARVFTLYSLRGFKRILSRIFLANESAGSDPLLEIKYKVVYSGIKLFSYFDKDSKGTKSHMLLHI